MLPKEKRLNLKTDFKRVASGKKLNSQYLTLFLKPAEILKIGIATSSKNFKKAHERNRARRITSAAFEKIYQDLLDIEIIALPKSPILDVKSNTVTDDLKSLLKDYLK